MGLQVTGSGGTTVSADADDRWLWSIPGAARRCQSDAGGVMSQDDHPRSDRVKFVYNAQFPAATAGVLNYLLNNPHFTGRQGRQQGMDAMMDCSLTI